MEKFSLEKYLENPSRKITTRYGDREVRIICTDRKDKRPIVALMIDLDDGSEYITSHSINGWIDDEEKYPDKRDLFFADEEELTEFEKEVESVMDNDTKKIIGVKYMSKRLLDLARKEMMKDAVEGEVFSEIKSISGSEFRVRSNRFKMNGIKMSDKVKIVVLKTE